MSKDHLPATTGVDLVRTVRSLEKMIDGMRLDHLEVAAGELDLGTRYDLAEEVEVALVALRLIEDALYSPK